MKNYPKIWGTLFGLVVFIFFGLLIYAGKTSENRGSILQTINTLNNVRVSSIIIAPENPDWKINLTLDAVRVYDKNKVDEIIFGLKKLTEKHLTKGAKRLWKCKLILKFDKSYTANLKNKEKLTFIVFNTDEGLFIEMTNTMGYTTYACQELKPLLEGLTDYQKPLGGNN